MFCLVFERQGGGSGGCGVADGRPGNAKQQTSRTETSKAKKDKDPFAEDDNNCSSRIENERTRDGRGQNESKQRR
jgi:hypothetical protein